MNQFYGRIQIVQKCPNWNCILLPKMLVINDEVSQYLITQRRNSIHLSPWRVARKEDIVNWTGLMSFATQTLIRETFIFYVIHVTRNSWSEPIHIWSCLIFSSREKRCCWCVSQKGVNLEATHAIWVECKNINYKNKNLLYLISKDYFGLSNILINLISSRNI